MNSVRNEYLPLKFHVFSVIEFVNYPWNPMTTTSMSWSNLLEISEQTKDPKNIGYACSVTTKSLQAWKFRWKFIPKREISFLCVSHIRCGLEVENQNKSIWLFKEQVQWTLSTKWTRGTNFLRIWAKIFVYEWKTPLRKPKNAANLLRIPILQSGVGLWK